MDLTKIRNLRENANLTQEELAKKSGVSRQTISSLENGTERAVMSSTLIAIAEALGTKIDIFLSDVSN